MAKKTPVPIKEKLHLLEIFNPGSPASEMAVKLLQEMIQVDTTNPPGNETILAEKLKTWVDSKKVPFVKTKIIGSGPTRGNLIIDIEGTSPDKNPTWGFMAHLDVVPAEGDWLHPPFSGELVDAEHDKFIWGRGALDVKSLGAAYLVAAFTAIEEGFRPSGNIKLLLCADEEQGGENGLGWLVEHQFDDVKVDYCINEGGGFKIPIGEDFVIQVGEKGVMWTKIKVKGQGGHASMPPAYDKFATYKIVKILERVKAFKKDIEINPEYAMTINALSLPGVLKSLLKRKRLLRGLLKLAKTLTGGLDIGQVILPMVTDTLAPTIVRAGIKENNISPEAHVVFDIRSLPRHQRADINAMLEKTIGKQLWKEVEASSIKDQVATTSPVEDRFYNLIKSTLGEIYPGANLVPMVSQGSTDSKFFRKKGITCYGFGPTIKDDDLTYQELLGLAHNANERISVTNLLLAVDFTYRLMKQM